MSSPVSYQHHVARAVELTLRDHLLDGAGATVSVWWGGIDGQPWYTRSPEAVHYAASTMKLPLLVAAHRRHERGEVDLDREVLVHNHFRSAFDGSPFGLDQDDDQDDQTWARLGTRTPLRDLVRHSIVRSGNLATNLVLEHVGAEEVAAVLRDAGCGPATTLPRGIEDAAARAAGLDNRVTAVDLARVLGAIAAGTVATPATCREVEQVLAAQEHREMIPSGLPAGTHVANKTGWVTGVAHDAALVRPDDGAPFVLVVCTTSGLDEAAANRLVAALSRTLWKERAR